MNFNDYFGGDCCGAIDGHDNIIDTGAFPATAGAQTIPIGFIPNNLANVRIQILNGYARSFSYRVDNVGGVLRIDMEKIVLSTSSVTYYLWLQVVGNDIIVTPNNHTYSYYMYRLQVRIWEES